MKRQYFKKLLKKHEENNLTEKEERMLMGWYESFDEGEDIKVLKDQAQKEQIYKQLQANLDVHIRKQKSRKTWIPYSIAASLVIAISASLFFYTSSIREKASLSTYQQIITTGTGKLKKIMLPDGSEVWLNAGTKIHVDLQHFTEKRDINLEDGEAFFNVSKNVNSPFRVIASDIVTQVSGTSFNVKAYKSLDFSSVQVKTGSVKVSTADGNLMPEILAANQSVTYFKSTKHMQRGKSLSYNADTWIKGVISLNNATFKELSLLLYNRFNIHLTSTDIDILGHHYTFTIEQDKPLEHYLKLIAVIHNNQYRRENNEIIMY